MNMQPINFRFVIPGAEWTLVKLYGQTSDSGNNNGQEGQSVIASGEQLYENTSSANEVCCPNPAACKNISACRVARAN